MDFDTRQQEIQKRRLRVSDLVARADGMVDKAEREGRDFTSMEQRRWDLTFLQIDGVKIELERLEKPLNEAISRRQREWATRRRWAALRRNPEETMRVAIHEAAHGVLAVLEGAGIENVALAVSARGGISGWFDSRREISTIVLAGGLAGEQLRYPRDEQGWIGPAASDYRWLRAAYRKRHLNAQGYAWIDLQTARNRLKPAWLAVKALASALAEKGALKGREAEEIVLANLPRVLRSQAKNRMDNAESLERALARKYGRAG